MSYTVGDGSSFPVDGRIGFAAEYASIVEYTGMRPMRDICDTRIKTIIDTFRHDVSLMGENLDHGGEFNQATRWINEFYHSDHTAQEYFDHVIADSMQKNGIFWSRPAALGVWGYLRSLNKNERDYVEAVPGMILKGMHEVTPILEHESQFMERFAQSLAMLDFNHRLAAESPEIHRRIGRIAVLFSAVRDTDGGDRSARAFMRGFVAGFKNKVPGAYEAYYAGIGGHVSDRATFQSVFQSVYDLSDDVMPKGPLTMRGMGIGAAGVTKRRVRGVAALDEGRMKGATAAKEAISRMEGVPDHPGSHTNNIITRAGTSISDTFAALAKAGNVSRKDDMVSLESPWRIVEISGGGQETIIASNKGKGPDAPAHSYMCEIRVSDHEKGRQFWMQYQNTKGEWQTDPIPIQWKNKSTRINGAHYGTISSDVDTASPGNKYSIKVMVGNRSQLEFYHEIGKIGGPYGARDLGDILKRAANETAMQGMDLLRRQVEWEFREHARLAFYVVPSYETSVRQTKEINFADSDTQLFEFAHMALAQAGYSVGNIRELAKHVIVSVGADMVYAKPTIRLDSLHRGIHLKSIIELSEQYLGQQDIQLRELLSKLPSGENIEAIRLSHILTMLKGVEDAYQSPSPGVRLLAYIRNVVTFASTHADSFQREVDSTDSILPSAKEGPVAPRSRPDLVAIVPLFDPQKEPGNWDRLLEYMNVFRGKFFGMKNLLDLTQLSQQDMDSMLWYENALAEGLVAERIVEVKTATTMSDKYAEPRLVDEEKFVEKYLHDLSYTTWARLFQRIAVYRASGTLDENSPEAKESTRALQFFFSTISDGKYDEATTRKVERIIGFLSRNLLEPNKRTGIIPFATYLIGLSMPVAIKKTPTTEEEPVQYTPAWSVVRNHAVLKGPYTPRLAQVQNTKLLQRILKHGRHIANQMQVYAIAAAEYQKQMDIHRETKRHQTLELARRIAAKQKKNIKSDLYS